MLDKKNLWWKTRAKYLFPYMELEEWLIGEVHGKGIVDCRYVGSYRETIGSLHYADSSSDIDMMYIYRDFYVSGKSQSCESVNEDCVYDGHSFNARIIDAETAGYVYVQLTQPVSQVVRDFSRISMKGEFHVSLEIKQLVQYFERNVICYSSHSEGAQGKPMSNGYYMKSDSFVSMHESFNRKRFDGWLVFQQCGPASKMLWNTSGLPQLVKICPLDMVFALHSPHWPGQAREWLSRTRKYGYPSRRLINAIQSYGVDVVAKSSADGEELEWRLSFSVAETKLVGKWNDTQKSCYRALKTLHTDCLSALGITSYSIKNIMFYLVEETNPGVWKPTKLVNCIFLVIRSLKKALKLNFCSHYFIRQCNLFRCVRKSEAMKAVRVCDSLLSDFNGQIWLSDGLWFEICSRGMEGYFYSIQESTDKWKEAHQTYAKSRSEWEKVFRQLYRVYYSVKVHTEVSKLFLNASFSKHFDEKDLLRAISKFILSQSSIKKGRCDPEYGLLFCQFAWVYTKCLQMYCNKQGGSMRPPVTLGTSRNRVDPALTEQSVNIITTKGMQYIQDGEIISSDSILDIAGFVNPRYAQQIQFASDILLGYETSAASIQMCENGLNFEDIPVVVSPLDCASKDENIAVFPFKGRAFFCPLNEFILYGYLKGGKVSTCKMAASKSFNELGELLSKPFVKRYHPIMYPFASYIHSKIKTLIENQPC